MGNRKDKKGTPPSRAQKSSASSKTGLSPEDEALWNQVTETVKPLEKDGEMAHEPVKPIMPKRRDHHEDRDFYIPSARQIPPSRIDYRQQKKISKGHKDIDRTIDLHGETRDRAYDILRQAVLSSSRQGHKVLLVITGKGGTRFSQTQSRPAAFRTREDFAPEGGVLRQCVPQWLSSGELSAFVHSVGRAADHHGGDGAFYVMLRRYEKTGASP